jgi:hypothetical protein
MFGFALRRARTATNITKCVYVDDVLVISHRAKEVIDSIGEIYKV